MQNFFRVFLISFSFLFYGISYLKAQDFNAFLEEKDIDKKIALGYHIVNQLTITDLDSIQIVAKEILKISNKAKYEPGIICGWFVMGQLYIKNGNEIEGINYLRKAKNYFLQKEQFIKVVDCIILIGNGYSSLGKYKEAITWFRQALDYIPLVSDVSHASAVEINLAQAHYSLKEYDEATKYANSYRDERLKLRATRDVANAFALLGKIELAKGNHGEAINHFEQCFDFSINNPDNSMLGHAYANIGIAYYMQDENDLALDAFKTSLKYREKVNNIRQLCDAYINISNFHFFMGEYEPALDYVLKGIAISREHKLYMNELELLEMYRVIIEQVNPKALPEIMEEIDVAEGNLRQQREEEFEFDAEMLKELNNSIIISSAGYKKPYYEWIFFVGAGGILIFFGVYLFRIKD